MAHKKAGGTATNLRDSKAKRLGVKLFDGQRCLSGNIIVRQRGTCFLAGENTMYGSDHTVFATADGTVKFRKKKKGCYDTQRKEVKVVSVQKNKVESVQRKK